MNYISNGTLPIYITLYILLGVKFTSICECLNPMTMQVCILSSFTIIIIIIIIVGVKGLGVHIYVCIGSGAQSEDSN